VLQDLRDVNHRERPPRHLAPSVQLRTENSLSSKDQGAEPLPRLVARKNADRAGRELPDRGGPSGREFLDRQHPLIIPEPR
jgi:hypothetical protein